jgi:ceramide glucosyltransferase
MTSLITVILLVLLAGAVVYSLLAVVAAYRYLAVLHPAATSSEPISILKPLAGADLDLESNLRTFFEQDYPAFELLFAVREPGDPAVSVVEKLRREYTHIPAQLLVTGEPPYPNAKAFSLDRMSQAAANDLVVRLEATGMNTDFIAGILVARMLEGMKFAVGPTIAARRSVLQSIGGFERLKDYLAEDFVLGKFAAEAGHGVILSSYVIEHHIGNSTLAENIAHRLRWARSTRRSRPSGYAGQLFTMPVPLALLACAVAPRLWPVSLLTVAVRAIAAYVVSARVLRTSINWLLVPIEDLLGFIFWISGFFGNTVVWRGRRYLLRADGRFELLSQ